MNVQDELRPTGFQLFGAWMTTRRQDSGRAGRTAVPRLSAKEGAVSRIQSGRVSPRMGRYGRKLYLRGEARPFNKAWIVWSLYRRRSTKDFQDNVVCFTCGIKVHYKEAHLGHYIHGKLDFSPIATQIQCPHCNIWKHGELGIYGEKLIAEHGQKVVALLRHQAHKVHKYTIPELEAIILRYQGS